MASKSLKSALTQGPHAPVSLANSYDITSSGNVESIGQAKPFVGLHHEAFCVVEASELSDRSGYILKFRPRDSKAGANEVELHLNKDLEVTEVIRRIPRRENTQ